MSSSGGTCGGEKAGSCENYLEVILIAQASAAKEADTGVWALLGKERRWMGVGFLRKICQALSSLGSLFLPTFLCALCSNYI